jgi:hypothetical protein
VQKLSKWNHRSKRHTCSLAPVALMSVSSWPLVMSAIDACIGFLVKNSSTSLEDFKAHNSTLNRGLLTDAIVPLATAYQSDKKNTQKSIALPPGETVSFKVAVTTGHLHTLNCTDTRVSVTISQCKILSPRFQSHN